MEELGEGCFVAQIATQNQVTGSSNAGPSSSSICSTLLSAPLVLHSQLSRPTVGLQVLLRQFHTTNSAQLVPRPPGLMLLTPFPGWLACPCSWSCRPSVKQTWPVEDCIQPQSLLPPQAQQTACTAQAKNQRRWTSVEPSHEQGRSQCGEQNLGDSAVYGSELEGVHAGRQDSLQSRACYSATPHFPEAPDEQRLSVDMCVTLRDRKEQA